MEMIESDINQVFLKLLDGKHKLLNFTTPSISVSALKHRIQTLTSIPSHLQFLLFNGSRIIHDEETLKLDQTRGNLRFSETLDRSCSPQFPVVVHLLLRLRGGKGGFGSLLRGAATKAGQKKTNNFDACRDMNGRRLRHVNAEKKLEEWRAEAEERNLEKVAEDYIKKKAKELVKSGKSNGGSSADKYVAKYREDSAKCMEVVDRSVRESIKALVSSKRKSGVEGNGSDSKRLKIGYGKRKLGDSDSESEDDSDEEGEDQKPVVIDTASRSDSSKEAEGSSGSVTGGKIDATYLDQGSSGSGPDGEDNVGEESSGQGKSREICGNSDDDPDSRNINPALEILEKNVDQNEVNIKVPNESGEGEETIKQLPSISATEEGVPRAEQVSNNIATGEPVHEAVSVNEKVPDLDKPLNFDEYDSASALEVLGMEQLKVELQSRGFKCGGTLQERAARLFLFKTTPLEMLPRKLFANSKK